MHSPLEMESLFLTQKGYPIKAVPKGLKFSWGSYFQAAFPSKMLVRVFMATLLNQTSSKIERPLNCVSQTTPAITRTFHLGKPKKLRVSGSSIKLTGNKEISKWMGSECTPRQRDRHVEKGIKQQSLIDIHWCIQYWIWTGVTRRILVLMVSFFLVFCFFNAGFRLQCTVCFRLVTRSKHGSSYRG